jgi:hypothetical protein
MFTNNPDIDDLENIGVDLSTLSSENQYRYGQMALEAANGFESMCDRLFAARIAAFEF